MPDDQGRTQHQERGRHRHVGRTIRDVRRAETSPLRQWAGVYLQGPSRNGCQTIGVEDLYIEPGSPWQNGVCESFNGKLRDEYLHQTDIVSEADGSTESTPLEGGLQRGPPTQLPRLPDPLRSSRVAVRIPFRSLRSLHGIRTARDLNRYLFPNQTFHNPWYRKLGHSRAMQ